MKQLLFALLLLSAALHAEPDGRGMPAPAYQMGGAAGYATYDTTVLSIMGWSFLLAGGIAATVLLIPNNTH